MRLLFFVACYMCLFEQILAVDVLRIPDAGYVDSLGHYRWFEGIRDSTFRDANGMKWLKWCEDSIRWRNAITIYKANVKSLIELGYDSILVLQNMVLFHSDLRLFDHLTHCLHPEYFIEDWRPAFNSAVFRWSARKKRLISRPEISIKFYPVKGGFDPANGMGLVKTNLLAHVLEAFKSKWGDVWSYILHVFNKTPIDSTYPKYNVYLINAKGYLISDCLKVGS